MKHKTCVTIAEKNPKNLYKTLKRGLKKSHYVEIRFDFLKPAQIPDALELVKKNLKRAVCTLRPVSEGGKFSGTEKERIAILKLISEYSPFLLDVEYKTLKKDKKLVKYLSKSDILVSWHDFKKTPSDAILLEMFKKMSKFSNFIKIVTTAKKVEDSARVLALYAKPSKNKLIAFAMGDYGKISRILCVFLGSPYTYVSLGRAVAPGQFSVDEMLKIFR